MTIAELQKLRQLMNYNAISLEERNEIKALCDRESARQFVLENLAQTLPHYAEHMAAIGNGLGIDWTPTLLELAQAAPQSEPPAMPHGARRAPLSIEERELIERNWLATRIGMMLGLWAQRGSIAGLRCVEWFMGVLDPSLPPLLAQSEAMLRQQFVAMTEQMVRAAEARQKITEN